MQHPYIQQRIGRNESAELLGRAELVMKALRSTQLHQRVARNEKERKLRSRTSVWAGRHEAVPACLKSFYRKASESTGTRELISTRKTSHKDNNKALSRLTVTLTWHECKYRVHNSTRGKSSTTTKQREREREKRKNRK